MQENCRSKRILRDTYFIAPKQVRNPQVQGTERIRILDFDGSAEISDQYLVFHLVERNQGHILGLGVESGAAGGLKRLNFLQQQLVDPIRHHAAKPRAILLQVLTHPQRKIGLIGTHRLTRNLEQGVGQARCEPFQLRRSQIRCNCGQATQGQRRVGGRGFLLGRSLIGGIGIRGGHGIN